MEHITCSIAIEPNPSLLASQLLVSVRCCFGAMALLLPQDLGACLLISRYLPGRLVCTYCAASLSLEKKAFATFFVQLHARAAAPLPIYNCSLFYTSAQLFSLGLWRLQLQYWRNISSDLSMVLRKIRMISCTREAQFYSDSRTAARVARASFHKFSRSWESLPASFPYLYSMISTAATIYWK